MFIKKNIYIHIYNIINLQLIITTRDTQILINKTYSTPHEPPRKKKKKKKEKKEKEEEKNVKRVKLQYIYIYILISKTERKSN